MSTTTARYQAELTADDQMTKVFKKVHEAQKKLEKGFEDMQKDATEFGKHFAVIAGAGVLAIKSFVDAANESERGVAQLNAVLKSTGGIAGVTKEQALGLAGSLQKVTTITDEAILGGENMLLTFTNIGKDVFPQATQTLLDMATAMNNGVTPSAEELSAKAITLGKALNDPTQGLAALSRVGVKFTEEQKKQIETLQKSGNIMAAQKIILGELGREFGGSAQAAAQTFSGKIENLSNRLGEIGEDIGREIIPMLDKFVTAIDGIVGEFEKLTPQQKEFIAQTLLIGTAIAGTAAGAFLLIGALNPVGVAVGAVVAAFAYLSGKLAEQGLTWEEFAISVQTSWAELNYWVEYYTDLVIYQLRRMTLATDEELQQLAADMDKHLAQTGAGVRAGYDQLNQIQKTKLEEQRKNLEDAIAAQRDVVDKSTGEQKKAERAKLDAMKEDALKHYADLKLGSTAELAALRKAEAAELDKRNAMYRQKLGETAEKAGVWGAHFLQNLISGIQSKVPQLSTVIGMAKKTMELLKFSKNPEIPSEIWGAHFVENFAAGMHEQAPKVFEKSEELKKILQANFGSDGAIQKLLKEWTKDKTISEHFGQIAEEVKQKMAAITDQFDKQKAAYTDLNLKAGQELAELKKKHEENLNAINKKIEDTKKQIADLNANYKINVQGVDTSIGEKVVEQQDLIEGLKKQIADAAAAGDNTDALQAQLDKENQALQSFMANAVGYEDEIAEARRRAGETDFERFIEDSTKRKTQLLQDYNDKLALLQQEQLDLEAQRAAEQVVFDQKVAAYEVVKAAFTQLQNRFNTGLSAMAVTAQQKIDFINAKLAALRDAMNSVSNIGTAATSAPLVVPGAKKFATGGVVDKPTFAMIGESGTEGVVPMPDGKNIPVKIQGDAGKQVTVNMNFGDIKISKEVDGDNFIRKMKDELTRAIQLPQLGSI